MQIENNKSLKDLNTFGIECKARYFTSVESIDQLVEALRYNEPKFILGGGSNILFTRNLDDLVVHIAIKGIHVIEEDEDQITLEVMAGEDWHDFVLYCIDHDYGGIENLSLIPGNVGTAPIQNIGAYGVELKDVLQSCKALSVDNYEVREFSNSDCNFDYRNSIFKSELKGKYIITSVTFKLTKKDHKMSLSYGAIKEHLEQKNITDPSIRDISETVIQIRQSKLPDPKDLGNGGSFFKNPIIDENDFKRFIKEYPKAPYYELPDGSFKIPAGWLIEKAGFKGQRFGNVGVHKKQALVLVNYGNAKGDEVRDLARTIQAEIKNIFRIKMEAEVNIV